MSEVLVDGAVVDYSGMPAEHAVTMRLYIEHGCEPGSGFTAILSNDLRAVVMVDADTFQQLPTIYRWLVNYAPSQAWGSRESMRAWMRERRAERERNAHVAEPLRSVINGFAEGAEW